MGVFAPSAQISSCKGQGGTEKEPKFAAGEEEEPVLRSFEIVCNKKKTSKVLHAYKYLSVHA